MSQIKQLLLLHQQGKGKKAIARTLGISKTTVKSYLNKFPALTSGSKAMSLPELVKLENPVLEAKFHAGNPAYKDDRYDDLISHMEYCNTP
ncbi:MAG: helix-turn-helix domain-containing protein [Cyclobacteriaceae bacterium]